MSSSALDYFSNLNAKNTYILADPLPDRQRLALQVKIYSGAFKQAIVQALTKYDLLARLQDPTATFRTLDIGCGEGLYFPILANILAEQGAKAKIEMVGIDRDQAAIVTAQEYTKALNIPNTEFFTHDLNNPLSQIPFFNSDNPAAHFDLIFASVVLMHLSNSPTLVKDIYHLLKPGGTFFTKDMTWVHGYNYPSPTFTRLSAISEAEMIKRIGLDFAPNHQQYLQEAGFTDIESFEDTYPIGGRSEVGRRMLQNFVLGQHSIRPMVIGLGLMSAQDYDAQIQQEFQEITPDMEGHITLVNTIGQRPN